MLREMPDMACLGMWMEFARLEPFGSREDDLRAAITSSTIAEIFRDKKEKSDPFTPADFCARTPVEQEVETDEPTSIENPGATMRAIELIMYRMGGKDYRTQRPRYDEPPVVVKR